jgi:hypothetical protein
MTHLTLQTIIILSIQKVSDIDFFDNFENRCKSIHETCRKTKKPQETEAFILERKTRLELATTSLEGWSSTN